MSKEALTWASTQLALAGCNSGKRGHIYGRSDLRLVSGSTALIQVTNGDYMHQQCQLISDSIFLMI
jgi:hypothetical protein